MKNARVRNEIPPKGNEKCAGQGMKNIESRNEKSPKGNEKWAGKGMKMWRGGMKNARVRNEIPPREMKNAGQGRIESRNEKSKGECPKE
jgi:hypothetical protein